MPLLARHADQHSVDVNRRRPRVDPGKLRGVEAPRHTEGLEVLGGDVGQRRITLAGEVAGDDRPIAIGDHAGVGDNRSPTGEVDDVAGAGDNEKGSHDERGDWSDVTDLVSHPEGLRSRRGERMAS